MDQRSLAGIRAKLERADEHLGVLTEEVRVFVSKDPHGYRTEVDTENATYVVRVVVEQAPPLRLSIVCGDFVHCLRSALDYAVAALVPEVTQRTAFPIHAEAEDFAASVTVPAQRKKVGPLTGLDTAGAHFAVIEACQPYHGPHGVRHHPLWCLRELSNADKHRAILVALAAHRRDPKISFNATDLEFVGQAAYVYDQPLKDGAEVLSGRFRVVGPDPRVELRGHLPIDLGFGNELVTTEGLNDIRKAVWSLADDLATRSGSPLIPSA